jgi:hypothetical protein
VPRARRAATTPAKYLHAKIDEIKITREAAEDAGSWAATASLHRLEVDVMALAWEREAIEAAAAREAAEAAEAARDGGAIFASILEAARALSPEMREQLVSALSHEPTLRLVGGQ